MNLQRKPLVLLLILFMLLPAFVNAVSPRRLNLGYKKFLSDNGEYNPYKFYPLGFSKKGEFAYIIFQDWADGIGNHMFLKIVVQNIKSDKLVYNKKIMLEPEDSTYKSLKLEKLSYNERFKTVWNHYLPEITSMLEKYNIKLTRSFNLMRFPNAKYRGRKYSCSIAKSDRDEMNHYTKYVVTMSNGKGGSKTISTAKDAMIMDAKAHSIFISPYEPRGAVIILTISRGFEGPPWIIYPKVIGCHMLKGFK